MEWNVGEEEGGEVGEEAGEGGEAVDFHFLD